MYIFFRVVCAFLTALFRSRVQATDETFVTLHVLPWEADLKYVNQARYATYFELARWDLVVRAGMMHLMLKKHWMPILGSQQILYRRSLARFDKFQVRSQLMGFDSKWLYWEQTIEVNGKVYCKAVMKALFRTNDRLIPTVEFLSTLGIENPNLQPPLAFVKMVESERQMLRPDPLDK